MSTYIKLYHILNDKVKIAHFSILVESESAVKKILEFMRVCYIICI